MNWSTILALTAKIIGTVGGAAWAAYAQSGTWQAAVIAGAAAAVGLVQTAPQHTDLTK